MSSKRPLVLMLVLLLMIGGYLTHDRWQPEINEWWELQKNPPLPGENSVKKLSLKQKDDAVWTVTIEYYYTGKPRFAQLMLATRNQVGGTPEPGLHSNGARPAERGLHT